MPKILRVGDYEHLKLWVYNVQLYWSFLNSNTFQELLF